MVDAQGNKIVSDIHPLVDITPVPDNHMGKLMVHIGSLFQCVADSISHYDGENRSYIFKNKCQDNVMSVSEDLLTDNAKDYIKMFLKEAN